MICWFANVESRCLEVIYAFVCATVYSASKRTESKSSKNMFELWIDEKNKIITCEKTQSINNWLFYIVRYKFPFLTLTDNKNSVFFHHREFFADHKTIHLKPLQIPVHDMKLNYAQFSAGVDSNLQFALWTKKLNS